MATALATAATVEDGTLECRACEWQALLKTSGMQKRAASNLPPGTPEFAVDREALSRFFQPPISKSTFHDLVSKGTITPVKEVRGFYRLNESLVRLGLQPVAKLPADRKRGVEDLARFGLSLVDPEIFPYPSWLLLDEPTDEEKQIGELIAALHRPSIEGFRTIQEKLAYGAGVVDAQLLVS